MRSFVIGRICGLLGFALGPALAGCGGPAGDEAREIGQAREGVINGIRDSGHSAVVVLDVGNEECSGTVIYPLTVLTAAHCTYAAANYGGAYVWINDDLAQGKPPIAAVASTNITWDPLFRPGTLDQHDVGLIFLDRPIPNVTPIPLYTGARLQAGGIALLVGYGAITNSQQDPNASKYYGFIPIGGYSNGVYWDWGDWVQGPSATTACWGDSGGPLLSWAGVPLSVAALVSGSPGDCTTPVLYPDILPQSNWINLKSLQWAAQH